MSRILYTFITLLFTSQTIAEISVIPAPLSIKETQNEYRSGTKIEICYNPLLKNEAEYLQSIFTKEGLQCALATGIKTKNSIVLDLSSKIKRKRSLFAGDFFPNHTYFSLITYRDFLRNTNSSATHPYRQQTNSCTGGIDTR